MADFARWGDLAFYKFENNQWVYFKTLLDYVKKNDEEYNKKAQEIGAEGSAQLNIKVFEDIKKKDSEQTLENEFTHILELLKIGIQAERENEIAYINKKLAYLDSIQKQTNNINDPEIAAFIEAIQELRTMIADIDSEGFDYNALITLINYIKQGVNQTKALVQYEYNHLKKLQDLWNNSMKKHKKTLWGLATSISARDNLGFAWRDAKAAEWQKRNEEKRNKKKLKIYLKNKGLSGKDDKIFRIFDDDSLKTSDVLIAEKITETATAIINSNIFKTKLYNTIKSNPYASPSDLIQELRTLTIHTVAIEVQQKIPEILSGTFSDKDIRIIANKFATNTLSNMALNIEGLPENFGYKKSKTSFITEAGNIIAAKRRIAANQARPEDQYLASQVASAEGLGRAVVDFYQKLAKNLRYQNMPKQQKSGKQAVTKWDLKTATALKKKNYNNDTSTKDLMELILQLDTYLDRYYKKPKKKPKKKSNDQKSEENIEKETTSKKGPALQFGKTKLEIRFVNGEPVIQGDPDLLKIPVSNNKTLKDFFHTLNTTNVRNLRSVLLRKLGAISAKNLFYHMDETKYGYRDIAKIEQVLQPLEVSISGPVISEVISGIPNYILGEIKMGNVWTGPKSVKNDFMTITFGLPSKLTLPPKFFINTKLKQAINQLQSELETGVNQFLQESTQTLESDMQKIQDKKAYTDYNEQRDIFESEQERQQKKIAEIEKNIKKTLDDIEKMLINYSEEDKNLVMNKLKTNMDNFLKQLEDSIYTSETMKTYNTYQNDIGFVGGSLGDNIESQLQSMAQLFENAGVPMSNDTIKWLTFAIINCSDATLGIGNKDLLETYLGSLAIFSLFNEGGAELKYLNEAVKNSETKITGKSNKNIMHLYRLNGIFYPGSYVLTQVLTNVENMMWVLDESKQIADNHNVYITNNINTSDSPNYKARCSGANTPISTDPWTKVREKAIKTSSIKIVFLAGLFDIITELHKQINNVELPA